MGGDESGKWLDDADQYSRLKAVEFMLAHLSDQMVGLRDILGLPWPSAPLGGREDIVRLLLGR